MRGPFRLLLIMRPSEYYFKEGCYIEEWHNTPDDQAMSVARVRVDVGNTTKLHSLSNTTERYIMLEGVAVVTVGGRSWEVTEGDVVSIQPGVSQKIQNTGSESLIFLAVCMPRFEVENYQEL